MRNIYSYSFTFSLSFSSLMLWSLVWLTCLVVMPVSIQAQMQTPTPTKFTLSGKITDAKNGQALMGATVSIVDTYLGVSSGINGGYELNDLPTGDCQIEIRLLGYETKIEKVTINGNTTLNIVLSPSEQLLDEMVISSTRASKNTATTYTNVSKEELDKLNTGQDIPFQLQLTPSAVVTSDAGAGVGYTGIRIRGTDPSRINVTVNGIPLNDSESHGVFWVNLPDFGSSTDNIQIQRGVGTSTNGAAAFGASINLQSNVLQSEAYVTATANYGTFNTYRGNINFGTGLVNDKFTVDGRLSKIESDGYVDRATSDLRSYYVSAAYYGKKDMLRVTAFSGQETTYQSWFGVPEGILDTNRTYNFYTYDNQVDNYQQNHYQLHYSRELGKSLTANAALHYTRGFGYYEEFQPQETLAFYGLENNGVLITQEDGTTIPLAVTDVIRRRWLDNHFYGLTYSLNYQRNRLNSILGGGWNRYDGDHFGEVIWAQFMGNGNIRHRYYDNVGDKRDFHVYWKNTYQLNNKLGIFTDLQFRSINYTINGIEHGDLFLDFDLNYNFLNPKIGVSYDVTPNQNLYASFALAHREPTRANIVDNNELPQPEQLRNLEMGYRFSSRNFSLNANYYLMDYRDQLVPTGNLNDVGFPIQQNVPHSYRTGIELDAGFRIGENIDIRANAAFSINQIDSFTLFTQIFEDDVYYDTIADTAIVYKDTDIAFSPNVVFGSDITYRPFKGASISLLSKYVGKQYIDNTSSEDRTIDAYFVSHVRLGYGFNTSLVKRIELNIMINNVFNSLYEANAYTYFLLFDNENGAASEASFNSFYPQAGTHLLGGVTIDF